MTFLALYLCGKFGFEEFTTVVVCGACWLCAVWVCVTRVVDFEHHFIDVIFGALLGLAFGLVLYRVHYRSVWTDDVELRRARKLNSKGSTGQERKEDGTGATPDSSSPAHAPGNGQAAGPEAQPQSQAQSQHLVVVAPASAATASGEVKSQVELSDTRPELTG